MISQKKTPATAILLLAIFLVVSCSRKTEPASPAPLNSITESTKVAENQQQHGEDLGLKKYSAPKAQSADEMTDATKEQEGDFNADKTPSARSGRSGSVPTNDYVDLPAAEKREVLGNWLTPSFGLTKVPCAFSLEAAEMKVYSIARCANGEGGKGRLVKRLGANKFVIPGYAKGTWVLITPSGDLSIRDNQGEINRVAKYPDLWPPMGAQGKLITPLAPDHPNTESPRTVGLGCSEVGYRYGFVAGLAMLGKKGRPEWDFVVPARCRQDPSYGDALQKGLAAASQT